MIKKQLLLVAAGIAAVAGFAFSQEFEVASVKPNKSSTAGGEGSRRQDVQAAPGNLTMQNVSLRTAVQWAYGIQDYQVSGGPNWLDSDRFDIVARPAAASTGDEMRLMLRALLADRFKLTFHRQSKELSAYALTVGKNGHKLQESKSGKAQTTSRGPNVKAESTSMQELAGFLSSALQTPAVDMTGLRGRYDFALDLTSFVTEKGEPTKGAIRDAAEMANILMAAIREQLGLVLEPKKLPVEMLVIDRVEKPAEN